MKKTIFDTGLATEHIINTFAVQAVNCDTADTPNPTLSPEDEKKAMSIYNKVADVFIDEKVDLWTSLKILSAMADALTVYIASRPIVDELNNK